MKRFCYRCGALEVEHGPLIKGLCQRCFAEENRLLRAPAQLEVVVCGRCGAHMLGNKWHQAGEGDAISEAARATALSAIRITDLSPHGTKLLRPQEAPNVALSILPRLKEGVIEVRASGKVHEFQTVPSTDEARITFKLKRRTCDVCSLKSARHHEAILQVRGESGKKKRSEIRAVLEQFADDASKRDKKAFVSQIEELKEGLDFYVNPANLARQMASLLKSNFGAEVKATKKLIGQTRDGRKKFRFSVLARLQSE